MKIVHLENTTTNSSSCEQAEEKICISKCNESVLSQFFISNHWCAVYLIFEVAHSWNEVLFENLFVFLENSAHNILCKRPAIVYSVHSSSSSIIILPQFVYYGKAMDGSVFRFVFESSNKNERRTGSYVKYILNGKRARGWGRDCLSIFL